MYTEEHNLRQNDVKILALKTKVRTLMQAVLQPLK